MQIRSLDTFDESAGNLQGRLLEFNKIYNFNGQKEMFPSNCEINCRDVRALYGHDKNKLLGRVGANLEITKRDDGLYFTLKKSASNLYKECLTLVKEGILKGCSIGFDSDGRMQDDVKVF